MKKLLAVLLLSLLVTACGPIWGQVMRVREGVKESAVVSGAAVPLAKNSAVLVYGPFAKGAEAYYVCPGEEAARIADELSRHGLRGEVYLAKAGSGKLSAEAVRQLGAEQLRPTLGLTSQPEYLLFGTLEKREATVAPTRGVVMSETYRLELLDVKTGKSTIYRIAVRSLAQETATLVVNELLQQSNRSSRH